MRIHLKSEVPMFEAMERSRPRREWGPWRLEGYELVMPGHYEIYLPRLTSSARVLDTICQVASKAWSWATPDVVGNLVAALNDILTPQANLCSFGADRRLRPEDIRLLIAQRPASPATPSQR